MPELSGYVATGVVSFVVGFLLRHFEPKPRLVYWFPHYFRFNLKDLNATLQTNSLTIQNTGQKLAEDIEITFQAKPDFHEIHPPMAQSEETRANGEYVIKLKSLGAKEVVALQLLSYKTRPVLLNVRSKEGVARAIAIQSNRVIAKWIQLVAWLCLIVGAGFIVYWIVRAIIFVSSNIGLG